MASAMPNVPCPAAISSTFHFLPAAASRTCAISSAMGRIIGAMDRANSTQIGFSAEIEPSPSRTGRPVRIPSARFMNAATVPGIVRKPDVEAMEAGERWSRNTAESGVRAYRPSCLVKNPRMVR